MIQVPSPIPLADSATASLSAAGILIKWSEFSNFSIDLYRSADHGVTWQAQGVDFTKDQFVDVNVNPNTTYFYKFEVTDGANTAYSGPVVTATPPVPVVALPDNLAATSVTDNGVTLNWGNFTNYTVSLNKSVNGGAFQALTSNLGASSFMDSQAVSPGTYVYVFTLTDGSGNSFNSPSLTITR